MTVLISIHDVTPAHAGAVRELWALCEAHGVVPALLVVPDWHGGWPLERHPEFVGWLGDRARQGATIVLHGFRHDEVGTRRSTRDHLRAWGRTDREGEFLALDRAAARDRIDRGIARLRAVGLEPVGFVPPAWLARPETHQAVAEAGLTFSEDHRRIRFHPGGSRRAPCVRWSARTGFRARASVAVALGRQVAHRRAALVRLALHPQDLSVPLVRRSVERAVERWVAHHPATGYAEVHPHGVARTGASA